MAACASVTYPSTIAQIADDGTKVVQSVHQLSLSAQQLQTANILTVPQTAQIVERAVQIERDGGTLATLLTTYGQIKTTVQGPITAALIQNVIADMDTALAVIGKSIPQGVATSLVSLAAQILVLIGQIKGGVLVATTS